MGTPKRGQAEKDKTTSETGKFGSKDTQNKKNRRGIWDMLGQMAGAWNRPEKTGGGCVCQVQTGMAGGS